VSVYHLMVNKINKLMYFLTTGSYSFHFFTVSRDGQYFAINIHPEYTFDSDCILLCEFGSVVPGEIDGHQRFLFL
jgi:hypothetical protein